MVDPARVRVKRLGVTVAVEEVLESDVIRRGIRSQLGDDCLEDGGGAGDERAEAYTSNSDDDGVWYRVIPVRADDTVFNLL